MNALKLTWLIAFLCLPFTLDLLAQADACRDFSRWKGILEDRRTGATIEYTPEEFFVGEALLPGYTGEEYQMPYFEFLDTTCNTDHFEIEFMVNNYSSGYIYVIGGVSIEWEPEDISLRSSSSGKIEFHDSIAANIGENSLRNLPLYSKLKFGLIYEDRKVYFTRNGSIYRWEDAPICKVTAITLYWESGGGAIESIRFVDYTNGSEYYEDFADCNRMRLFDECAPEPEVTLTGSFIQPSCKDRALRLFANSNLLEEYHWTGPGGFASNEQNPVIADGALSGTYTVWGKLHRCAVPVKYEMDITIPDLLVTTEYVEAEICEGDSVLVGENSYRQPGLYIDTLESGGGCSIIYTHVTVLPVERTFFSETIEEGNFIFWGGEWIGMPGIYTDTLMAVNGCDSLLVLSLDVLPYVDRTQIPTVFTPYEQNEVNDDFMPGYMLLIFDRYGNLICESKNGWDGKYRGKYAGAGVYIYVVTMKDGRKVKGTIEVLRN